ncbi:MAG: Sua5 family C-terminal domain-containing protein, partial [Gammaproteobacteria bacterium]
RPALVRPGPIPLAALEAVAGVGIAGAAPAVRAPGTEAVHYQPRARLVLVAGSGLRERLAQLGRSGHRPAALLCGDDVGLDESVPQRRLPAEADAYARQLYDALHALDAGAIDVILVQTPPGGDAWRAVNDRLGRAAAPDDATA